jgi:uncharacterized membrane protein
LGARFAGNQVKAHALQNKTQSKERAMSNIDRNLRDPDNQLDLPRNRISSSSMAGAAVVVVVALIAVGYIFSDRPTNTPAASHHPAAMTTPAAPAPTATPETAPKP